MTHQAAERALSELEAYSRRNGWHDTDVQGRRLEAAYHQFQGDYTYRYANEVITRKTAIVILENR